MKRQRLAVGARVRHRDSGETALVVAFIGHEVDGSERIRVRLEESRLADGRAHYVEWNGRQVLPAKGR